MCFQQLVLAKERSDNRDLVWFDPTVLKVVDYELAEGCFNEVNVDILLKVSKLQLLDYMVDVKKSDALLLHCFKPIQHQTKHEDEYEF